MPSRVLDEQIAELAAAESWPYRASQRSATEPAAWSALALIAHGELPPAQRVARWLGERQQRSGAVGISAADDEPRWPTSLAILAWTAVDHWLDIPQFGTAIEKAVAWSLNDRGQTAPRAPEVGHDTSIVGWSWAAGTHSWLEPTAMFVMGLKAAGFKTHQRVRDGVRLLVDRLLPGGGANYGNTIVLGQTLLPHVQPTGLAMLALAAEADDDGRIEASLDYLASSLQNKLTNESLSYAVMGLAAHGRRPENADSLIHEALERDGKQRLSAYDRALLVAAARAELDWLAANSQHRGLNDDLSQHRAKRAGVSS